MTGGQSAVADVRRASRRIKGVRVGSVAGVSAMSPQSIARETEKALTCWLSPPVARSWKGTAR